MKDPVTIIGAGSYGTALAFCLARNGVPTYMWGHEPDHLEELLADRENQRFLPGYPFPEDLHIEMTLESAVGKSRDILIVVPSHGFTNLLTNLASLLSPAHRIIWATKGLEPGTGRLLSEVADELLGSARPKAVLSGPTFAKEMAAGLPTAISLSATDDQLAEDFSKRLHCTKTLRVYRNNDRIGQQLGGAVKNVIAIGAGLADGLGFGANARTALITRGLARCLAWDLRLELSLKALWGWLD